MQQTRQAPSREQTISDRWIQGGNGLWLPKQHVPQAPLASPSRQKRRQHSRQSLTVSASKLKKPQRLPWPQRRVAGKTLWDWMSLLLIPLLIGIGTIWVTNRQTDAQNALSVQLHQSDQAQHQQDEKRAQRARWDDLLKQYRDGIDNLLLHNGLRHAHPGDDVSEIAHARTLDVLGAVDPSRRRLVIDYLNNLHLIQGIFWDSQGHWHRQKAIISLWGADLNGADLTRANLEGVDLEGVDLRWANLKWADLSLAGLNGADLRWADLGGAFLEGVDLEEAFLNGAHLEGAGLYGAFLNGAFLNGAHLERAFLNGAHLERANLKWADLSLADLNGAHLERVDLEGVDLRWTNLRWADLTRAHLASLQLQSVFSLSGTILPDGSVCKKLPDSDFFNEKKQAESRDACLAQAKAWNISG